MNNATAKFTRAAMVLSALGVVLAAYLTWVHFNTGSLVCGLGDCHTVQASEYATIGPVPVAVLGLGMYAVVFLANAILETKPNSGVLPIVLAFGVLLAGTFYAIYLTWLEISVIRAICQWCVASALLSLLLLGIQSIIVRDVIFRTEPVREETRSASLAS